MIMEPTLPHTDERERVDGLLEVHHRIDAPIEIEATEPAFELEGVGGAIEAYTGAAPQHIVGGRRCGHEVVEATVDRVSADIAEQRVVAAAADDVVGAAAAMDHIVNAGAGQRVVAAAAADVFEAR